MIAVRNAAANLAGNAWTAIIGLVFLPLYLRVLGPEAYGVVGVLASLTALLSLLDLGLSQTLSRETARVGAQCGEGDALADLIRTFEVAYWAMAVVVGLLVWACAAWLARHWLNPQDLGADELHRALWMVALVIAVRWPIAVYTGALNGLQRQPPVAATAAIAATLQGCGAALILLFVSPSLHAFLGWQALVAALQVFALRWLMNRSLPIDRSQGRVQWGVVTTNWRFAVSVSGVYLSGTVLTQVDKIVLSRTLDLAQFGYYVFAVNVASLLMRASQPVATAYFPRFAQLVASDDLSRLRSEYLFAGQLMAALVMPAGLILGAFSEELLRTWTARESLVAATFALVTVLVLGNLINALITLPSTLELSLGNAILVLRLNWFAVLVLAPLTCFMAWRWGSIGAAWAWVLMNAAYFAVIVTFVHRRRLRDGQREWWQRAFLRPLIAGSVLASAAKWLALSATLNAWQGGLLAVTAYLACVAGVVMATPDLRVWLVARLSSRKNENAS